MIYENEKIETLLIKISLPIFISLLVSELYNMVDTIFVGNFVSASGIGALSVVFPIQRIVIALSIMLGIGTSTAFTRARGAKDDEKARKIITSGFTLVFLLIIPLILFVSFRKEEILMALGASDDILIYGVEYLKYIILGSIFLSLTIFTSNIMISLNKSKIAIISTSIGAIVNIIIDYILVVGFKMGVKGAAIATLASQMAGFFFAYYHLYNFKKENKIKKGFTINKHIFIIILSVGVSAFIVEAEDGILMAILNNLLHQVSGNEGIIILAAVTKVYMFLFVLMFAIANGMQPIAAYNVGAKNYKRLKQVLKKTIILAVLVSSAVWLFSFVFAENLLSIFVTDDYILYRSVKAFRYVIAFFPLISFYYISIFYFQSLGKAKMSIILSVLRQVVIMIPLSIILVKVFNLGALGVWLSYPIADLSVSFVSMYLLYKEVNKLETMASLQVQTAS